MHGYWCACNVLVRKEGRNGADERQHCYVHKKFDPFVTSMYFLYFSLFSLTAQAFVSCTLGTQMVAGALIGMALMQVQFSLHQHIDNY